MCFFLAWHLLMNAKLKRMGPLVQCTDDAMTLRVKGVKTPHFLVDNGEINDTILWICREVV